MNPIPILMRPEIRTQYIEVAALFGEALKSLYEILTTIEKDINFYEIELIWFDICYKVLGEQILGKPWTAMMVFANQTNHLGEKFKHSICLSVNNCVAHGKNTKKVYLGDIVTIDTGIAIDIIKYPYERSLERKLIFDSAFTCILGDKKHNELTKAPLEALKKIETLKGQITTHDIAKIIQEEAWSRDFSIISELCGHGIGYSLHEWPGIPNTIIGGASIKLPANIFINPEPMYVQTQKERIASVYINNDGWSVMAPKPSAHWETTFYYDGNKMTDIVGLTKIN